MRRLHLVWIETSFGRPSRAASLAEEHAPSGSFVTLAGVYGVRGPQRRVHVRVEPGVAVDLHRDARDAHRALRLSSRKFGPKGYYEAVHARARERERFSSTSVRM